MQLLPVEMTSPELHKLVLEPVLRQARVCNSSQQPSDDRLCSVDEGMEAARIQSPNLPALPGSDNRI